MLSRDAADVRQVDSETVDAATTQYDPLAFPLLVPLTRRLLERKAKPGTPRPVAYFAAQLRNEASMREFEEEVAKQGCLRLEVLHFEPLISFQHLLRAEGLDNCRMFRIQCEYEP